MSYSFSVLGADKATVEAAITAELEKVVASQPVHAADKDQALAAAKSLLATMADDATRDISVSMSGSIWSRPEGGVEQVNLNINIGFNGRT